MYIKRINDGPSLLVFDNAKRYRKDFVERYPEEVVITAKSFDKAYQDIKDYHSNLKQTICVKHHL